MVITFFSALCCRKWAAGNPSRVNKFNSAGQLIATWDSLGSAPDQLDQPQDLTLDQNNKVYGMLYCSFKDTDIMQVIENEFEDN